MKSKKKNFVEKFVNFLLNILIFLFGIILLISIYTSVQTKVLGNDYTDFFGYSIFEVETGSMAKTINIGDWILVKLTHDVKLNDVVTYKLKNEYITHRIIEVYNSTYITKGDANNAKDDPVDRNQIIGRVVKTIPNFGIFRKTLFNPSVLVALIVTLFLFNFAFKKSKSQDNSVKKVKETNKKERKVKDKKSLLNNPLNKIKLAMSSIVKKVKIDNKTKKKDNVIARRIGSVDSDIEYLDIEEIKERELDKTLILRNIPVPKEEVTEKFTSFDQEKADEEEYKDDELDKTSVFRVISVDKSEINDTFLEIAKNELKEANQKDVVKEQLNDKDTKLEEVEKGLTKINLELLKSKKRIKKSKNLVEKAMFIKKEELEEILSLLIDNTKQNSNLDDIKEIFINCYIETKYYNNFSDGNTSSSKSISSNIEKVIRSVANQLVKDYHGNDTKYKDKVSMYENAFLLINNLDQAKDSITDSKAKEEYYKEEIILYSKGWNKQKQEQVTDEIIKIQKNYISIIEYFLKKLETAMFTLNFHKLNNKKDMFAVELEHNISFSKVYSEYIIDKTYTEGVVAEDKVFVEITLLLVQQIKDMLLSLFNRKYVLYIPTTLYTKEKKFEQLLKTFDDEYAKNNTIILIPYKELLKKLRIVKKIRKMGYKYALVFDENTVIQEKDRGNLYIADYIFINKKFANTDEILSTIPADLSKKLVYENIVDKIGDVYEGE